MTIPASRDHSVLEVDLGAIAYNWNLARAAYTGTRLGAVVKNDAYGLGIAHIAPWLDELGCRDFWVATLEEGLDVRRHISGSGRQVFVLNGLGGLSVQEHESCGLIPVLSSRAEVLEASAQARRSGRALTVAVHLDTGLCGVGLDGRDVAELSVSPDSFNGLKLAAWVTQLARFDTPDQSGCPEQFGRFSAWTAVLPAAPCSIAATMSVFSPPQWHLDLARVGSGLYGVETDPKSLRGFQPAATLKAPILRVQNVPAGTAVGYGGRYRTARAARLASVAIGYGSGLPVSFSDGGKVHIGGHVAPVVGGVSMGLITADVSRIPEPLLSLDVPAEIYGRHHSVHQQALAIGVTPNALLVPTARLAGRRVYVHALRDVRPEAETLQS